MPKESIPSVAHPAYAKLRSAVHKTLLLGQKQIEQAKVRTYYETGKHIQEHIARYGSRSEHYGAQVVEKLSVDLGISTRVLRQCVQFARNFKIVNARSQSLPAQLPWTHYRQLMTIPDEDARISLMKRAEKSEWSERQLAEKIRLEVREAKSPSTNGGHSSMVEKKYPKLIPKRGELYTYRLIAPEAVDGEAGLWIDLGFQVRRTFPQTGAMASAKGGQIVESKKTGEIYSAVPSKRTEADLFTFQAPVERVVDGDTLIVNVDLGFDTGVRQYLRLRGINCPELDTPEGKRAKAFVEKELGKARRIILTSSRSDKYDRYLADVFIESTNGERYLNQALLDEGLAVRME